MMSVSRLHDDATKEGAMHKTVVVAGIDKVGQDFSVKPRTLPKSAITSISHLASHWETTPTNHELTHKRTTPLPFHRGLQKVGAPTTSLHSLS